MYAQPNQQAMTPFIIKNKKNINSKKSRKWPSIVPTYKKHRDDDDDMRQESDSESDTSSATSTITSSSASSTALSSVGRGGRDAMKRKRITPKTLIVSSGGQDKKRKPTTAADMVVGKIAEALASSVIAAAIAGGGGKKQKKRSSSHRNRDEDEDEEEYDDDEEENGSDNSDEEDRETDDDDDDESQSEDDSEDDDSDDDDSDDEDDDSDDDDDDDSEYDSEDDDDDDDSEDYDSYSSDGDDERRQKQHKKQQTKMEQCCEKNKKHLAEIKATIETLAETMNSNASLASNKFMKKQLEEMKRNQRDIENRLRVNEKKRDRLNVKEFKTLLRKKNSTNDLRYFRRNMTPVEQQKVISDLKKIHAVSIIEKPYRLSLLETDIPIAFKAIAMRKINSLRHMEPGCGEYYKVKNWVDTFMKIPFNKTKNLPLTIEDGLQRCSEFMEASKTTLDSAVYGLNDAKLQIMQMVGQWISNPGAMGSAIAIQGPMGTGKTSLVKEGISKILGRDFAFIALGGATDSSFLEGHSYTYEGSTWGKIVEILIQCRSMNPVIYFDELDKISETAKGEEIVGILTHLTDTSQN